MKTFLSLFALSALAAGGTIMPGLEEVLVRARPDELVDVMVQPCRRADLSSPRAVAGYDEKLGYLRSAADSVQRDILGWLATTGAANVRPFLLAGRIALSATPAVVRELAARADVDYVIDDFAVFLEPAGAAPTAEPDCSPRWNISIIRAPECWVEGYDGAGVVVASITTGVETTHEALSGRWRATDGWFDAVNSHPDPYDDNGHGTHTIGSAVGGCDIGVAPGATYIAAKAINAGGAGQSSWILACLDWLAEHGRPDVLLAAWTSASRYDEFWFAPHAYLRYLGIIHTATIGSSGPNGATSLPPGSYPVAIGVGATDSSDEVAVFSARGPAPDRAPWNGNEYWPRPDWNLINPGIAAPGVNILSARHTGGYLMMSGTAMATAHAAGAVAVLRQKDPGLTHDEAFSLLADHAARPSSGAPYPNQSYGWGRLDVKAALDAVQVGMAGPPYIGVQPGRLSLAPNPPAGGWATLHYSLPGSGPAGVTVRDVTGRVVAVARTPDHLAVGSLPLDLRALSGGVHFVTLETAGFRRMEKFVLPE
ncbi:MAG TPA: hypothetical protein ENN51_08490 [candidate division WOR-3 bacterium]|uniref:Peptidase S8/S53 domain-containing protein n=1 Tax=candidate division WOR-3 bacterium TaxID=2052148 RepID=A0A7V0T6X3_UNCW3|nr:hypothetical protein [candidate division WOR-3 bacterium]